MLLHFQFFIQDMYILHKTQIEIVLLSYFRFKIYFSSSMSRKLDIAQPPRILGEETIPTHIFLLKHSSISFSDKSRFGYFFRVVPSDYYQVRINYTRELQVCLLGPKLQPGCNSNKSSSNICTSAWKSPIRRFVITEKAPTRAFSWLKAATTDRFHI